MSQEIAWSNRYRDAGEQYLFRTEPNEFLAHRVALLHGTGGPSAVENLYTEELLRAVFADWKIEELVEYEDHIAGGMGHKGRSALIGLIAQKPLSG